MSLDKDMTNEWRRAFVLECEIPESAIGEKRNGAAMRSVNMMSSASTDPMNGAVVANNLMMFDDGVSSQNRQDITDSFLFASLVADKAFNRETKRLQWYDQYNKVLATLGWVSTRWNYSRYQSMQQSLKMDQVALEIIGSAIAAAALPGPASAAMLAGAANAVKALQKSGQPLTLFEKQSKTQTGAGFQVGTCTEDAIGTVNVAMGAVSFTSTEKVERVLFWEYKNASLEVYRAQDKLMFNTRHYAQVRDTVQKKLGRHAEAAVAGFEI